MCTSNWQTPQPRFQQQPLPHGGLPVRTTLRAGLAWDDLDDQAQARWDKLTKTVTSATTALTGNSDTNTAAG
ncbi:MAG: hypothetical protein ACOYNY_08525 [Caldilineaceae bacterium]